MLKICTCIDAKTISQLGHNHNCHRPLVGPTWSAQSVVTDLRPLGLGVLGGRGWTDSIARSWAPISSHWRIYDLSLTVLCYLAGSKSFSSCPPSARPGYDDKYRSISYRFVAGQNWWICNWVLPAPWKVVIIVYSSALAFGSERSSPLCGMKEEILACLESLNKRLFRLR